VDSDQILLASKFFTPSPPRPVLSKAKGKRKKKKVKSGFLPHPFNYYEPRTENREVSCQWDNLFIKYFSHHFNLRVSDLGRHPKKDRPRDEKCCSMLFNVVQRWFKVVQMVQMVQVVEMLPFNPRVSLSETHPKRTGLGVWRR